MTEEGRERGLMPLFLTPPDLFPAEAIDLEDSEQDEASEHGSIDQGCERGGSDGEHPFLLPLSILTGMCCSATSFPSGDGVDDHAMEDQAGEHAGGESSAFCPIVL